MRLTVVGGCGAWPAAGQACSGFLVEHDGFRLVVDLGYATVPRLLQLVGADEVDAVFISHGHPDHCVDLNPLLRARVLGGHSATASPPSTRSLPVYALPGALDAVLALDRPGLLAHAYRLHEFEAGARLDIGPFHAETRLLPHFVPNAGVRLTARGPLGRDQVLAYTGDSGPCSDVVELARGADLLLAEATHVEEVPDDSKRFLTTARQAGRQAHAAGVERLVLTHLWPGTDAAAARRAAGGGFAGRLDVAVSGLVVDL
jgi:ribonuclease BN (tRNA processing enzyme)